MQIQETTTLFLSTDPDSCFAELLVRYLRLDQRFQVHLVRNTPSLVQAGTARSPGVVPEGLLFVDKTGKYLSSKVIAHKLTAMCNLDELLMGDGAQEVSEVVAA